MSHDFSSPSAPPPSQDSPYVASPEQASAPVNPYGAPAYGAPPAYSGAPTQMSYSTEMMMADKAAQMSLIFGILGVLLLPIVFGPLALWQAKKAEAMNKSATAGKVLGWVGVAMAIVGVIVVGFVFIAAIAGSAAGY